MRCALCLLARPAAISRSFSPPVLVSKKTATSLSMCDMGTSLCVLAAVLQTATIGLNGIVRAGRFGAKVHHGRSCGGELADGVSALAGWRFRSNRRTTTTKNSGTKKTASIVAVIIPPITPVPMACLLPELAPLAIASGITPTVNASEVMPYLLLGLQLLLIVLGLVFVIGGIDELFVDVVYMLSMASPIGRPRRLTQYSGLLG